MKSTAGTVMGRAKQVEAVRRELSEAERDMASGKPGARAMVSALRRDLLVLETRLAAMSVAS